MSHLNIRTSEKDERNILLLKSKWHLDRSEVTRKALSLAASMIEAELPISKEDLLKNSKFIGSDSSSEVTSTNYKNVLKKSLRKKYDY